ncbi:DUF4266 domain-containing protein [Robiginitalea sp. IMCC44478]|uniref:DUF4266 domain-containing protein n=1 Tax=Robiginitalea sp. IMCC44478 TaxID=3459122 RepID=UPI0040434982
MRKIIFFGLLAGLLQLQSCVVIKEYEMVNLNDPDMSLTDQKCDRNLIVMHSYREGAAGANGGKTGGGCGCN